MNLARTDVAFSVMTSVASDKAIGTVLKHGKSNELKNKIALLWAISDIVLAYPMSKPISHPWQCL